MSTNRIVMAVMLLASVSLLKAGIREKNSPTVAPSQTERYLEITPHATPQSLRGPQAIVGVTAAAEGSSPGIEVLAPSYYPTQEDHEILERLVAVDGSLDLEKDFLWRSLRISDGHYEQIKQKRQSAATHLQASKFSPGARLAVLNDYMNWMRGYVGLVNYDQVQEIIDLGDEGI